MNKKVYSTINLSARCNVQMGITLKQYKILVGSPICQKPEILEAFLGSLKNLKATGIRMDYLFVDDNVNEESTCKVSAFERASSAVTVLKGKGHSNYMCDEKSHYWDDDLMLRVAEYKNRIIQYAIDNSYDALFLADSDLVLHPDLVLHLKRQGKEIVSEIFWTQWHSDQALEPNVWLFDEYDLIPKRLGETLTQSEMDKRKTSFLEMLRTQGCYEVGGLGACTLITREALLKGVNFAPIKNLTIHGEDRFFCIRAAVLGIPLFVDTNYPAYHIYRETDLAGVDAYTKECQEKRLGFKITLSMVVKNEEKRYLRHLLESLHGYIDEAVIIDDASTDDTVSICENLLSDIPLHLIRNTKSIFENEVSLRKLQWEETIKTNPDWILNLDADEFIEAGFWKDAQEIMNHPSFKRCCFYLYDMWNEGQYREDSLWNAHQKSRTFLIRYQSDVTYQWNEIPQHCGRFPTNCNSFVKADKEYKIQHFGWATKEDRVRKLERYQRLDPKAIYGIKAQYESILDENPTLVSWQNNG